MTVLAPCDETEVRLLLRAALKRDAPVYMRIGKKGEPRIHQSLDSIEIGRAITVREGDHACLIAAGTIMGEGVKAAEILDRSGIRLRVISCHTIKPLDERMLAEVFRAYSLVAVAEEHGRIGGLAGSIAEWRAHHDDLNVQMLSFGADDVFLHEIGSQDYARRRFGLDGEHMAERIRYALQSA
jgi:transketolase